MKHPTLRLAAAAVALMTTACTHIVVGPQAIASQTSNAPTPTTMKATESNSMSNLQSVVIARERAFAKTMADRDFTAFLSFVADDAIFFERDTPLRGKQAVAGSWQSLYAKPAPPFSWEPEIVEVLASGNLALSTGPVRTPDGKTFARFQSIWRLEADGVWRVVFDKGNDVCNCTKP
jgi:ketosteroid isomerase-like protein